MPLTLRWLPAFLVVFLCVDAALGSAVDAANPMFRTQQVRIAAGTRTIPLQVELAITPKQHALGLMDRASLPSNHGMLFLFSEPQSATSAFWMFRTRIPLAIAFLNPQGRIMVIQPMAPCESLNARGCPIYPAGVSYAAALEVNQGYFKRHEIKIGDRMMPAKLEQAK